MKENPELKIEARDIQVKPEEQLDDTVSGRSGGVPNQGFNESRLKDAKNAEELAEKLKNTADNQNATQETVEKPFDISFLKNKIGELEAKANTQGWFKKQFGGTEETLRRLKLGLRKVEDPKLKHVFLKGLEDSYKQGQEKLALEYIESIGNGELVYPKDGVLMAKSSQDTYFPS